MHSPVYPALLYEFPNGKMNAKTCIIARFPFKYFNFTG